MTVTCDNSSVILGANGGIPCGIDKSDKKRKPIGSSMP